MFDSPVFTAIFWMFTGIWSYVYGKHAFEIHPTSDPKKDVNAYYKYTQYLVNGGGAFLGWLALYFALHLHWQEPNGFGWQHLVLSYIAYLGISGQLPFVAKFSFIKQ